ncbi:hypothetical protein TNCV_663841 [Trichonephila clavipes]|nr:hypothetical protein TNCV_663841 [Trichonephila clavipes]
MPRSHQAGFSRRSLAGVGVFESVRCHGPCLALLTNGGVQQQQKKALLAEWLSKKTLVFSSCLNKVL